MPNVQMTQVISVAITTTFNTDQTSQAEAAELVEEAVRLAVGTQC